MKRTTAIVIAALSLLALAPAANAATGEDFCSGKTHILFIPVC